MEPFRNIGIIGRLGSPQVLETIRRLKRFLIERHLHVILEDTISEVLPGHGLQTCSRKIMGEICDLVIVVGGDGSMLGAARGFPPAESARLGALAAAEVISHVGARPQHTLSELAREAGFPL